MNEPHGNSAGQRNPIMSTRALLILLASCCAGTVAGYLSTWTDALTAAVAVAVALNDLVE